MRRRILVSGRVQGVGFRYATLRQAERLGLRGWVRNTSDGKVEIAADGERDAVDRLVVWCRQGPPGARVSDVCEFELDDPAPLGEFHITHR